MQTHKGPDERIDSSGSHRLLARVKSVDEKTYLVALLACIMAILVLPPLFFLILGAVTVSDAQGVNFTLERFPDRIRDKCLGSQSWVALSHHACIGVD